jgi:MoaA/NifB/PqqE/SkfB family radical SAM enzyme
MCVVLPLVMSEQSTHGDRQILTTAEWKRVIDDVPRLALVSFTGGEPLVRSDIVELIRHASRRHKTHLITNATLLDEEKLSALMDMTPRRFLGAGFSYLGVSLHGLRETHNTITGLGDAFERAAEALTKVGAEKRRRGSRYPIVHLATVVMAGNIAELPDIVDFAASVGAEICNVLLDCRVDEMCWRGEMTVSDFSRTPLPRDKIDRAEFERVIIELKRRARTKRIQLRLPRMPVREMAAFYENCADMSRFACGSVWTKAYVAPTGTVHPCYELAMGNVRETSLKAIWNSAEYRAFRQQVKRRRIFPLCAGCCNAYFRG